MYPLITTHPVIDDALRFHLSQLYCECSTIANAIGARFNGVNFEWKKFFQPQLRFPNDSQLNESPLEFEH